MSEFKPSQVFASIGSGQTQTNPKMPVQEGTMHVKPTRGNEIQVMSTGELSLSPDRCKVTFYVSSAKDLVQEVKNSVARRLDYIIQTLHNHQVKETDIHTSKVLKKVDGLYHLDAEVATTFYDFNKCQSVCNFLVEKLGDSVKVSTPEFSQSPQRLENLRRQTSLLAVRNAKQKATEMAQFLHAVVGKVLAIREENCSEWEGPADGSQDVDAPVTVQQRMVLATVHVTVQVSASFELKSKTKNRAKKQ